MVTKLPIPGADMIQNGPANDTGPQLKILNQYISDLSFESPKAPQSLKSTDPANMQLEVGITTRVIEPNVYECAVKMDGMAVSKSMMHYNLELTFCGLFEITGFSPVQTQQVLFVNCPALMFPFMRQIVGDLTRGGGFSPIWLDPIDWGGQYLKRYAGAPAEDRPVLAAAGQLN